MADDIIAVGSIHLNQLPKETRAQIEQRVEEYEEAFGQSDVQSLKDNEHNEQSVRTTGNEHVERPRRSSQHIDENLPAINTGSQEATFKDIDDTSTKKELTIPKSKYDQDIQSKDREINFLRTEWERSVYQLTRDLRLSQERERAHQANEHSRNAATSDGEKTSQTAMEDKLAKLVSTVSELVSVRNRFNQVSSTKSSAILNMIWQRIKPSPVLL